MGQQDSQPPQCFGGELIFPTSHCTGQKMLLTEGPLQSFPNKTLVFKSILFSLTTAYLLQPQVKEQLKIRDRDFQSESSNVVIVHSFVCFVESEFWLIGNCNTMAQEDVEDLVVHLEESMELASGGIYGVGIYAKRDQPYWSCFGGQKR